MNALLLAVATAFSASTQGDDYLYKIVLVQAAPGRLLELIDLYQDRMAVYDAAGDEQPFMIRHSQGDHWDLMLVFPVESMSAHYASDRVERRRGAAAQAGLSEEAFADRLQQLVAWREETFFTGPSIDAARPQFGDAGYFHVEMFIVLPGKNDELYREREMENEYLRLIGRPENLIFSKVLGGSWDAMTIGFYRDIKHYAESADVSAEREQAAALAAGFEGADRIGTYLRELIARHNDTLGTAVR